MVRGERVGIQVRGEHVGVRDMYSGCMQVHALGCHPKLYPHPYTHFKP